MKASTHQLEESKYSVLLVEDEPLALNRLHRLLKDRYPYCTFTQAENGLEAVKFLNNQCFDIVFLDIELPELSGIELLENLEEHKFKLIFCTAYSEYALEAFKKNACDYILKPYSPHTLYEAFEKASRQLINENLLRSLQKALSYTPHSQEGMEKIILKKGLFSHIISSKHIDFLSYEEGYTTVFTGNEEFLCDLSLKSLEERLPSYFFRVHRSYIINLHKIKKIITQNEMICVLEPGHEIVVSRRNRKAFKEKILSMGIVY